VKSVLAQSKLCRPDLLILGAGPAGCAAAILALQAGMNVVLLEARTAVRPTPGETLHPGLEPIFKRLGVWESILNHRFHRHRGIWREGEDGIRVFDVYGSDQHGPWLGFQVNRADLAKILQTRVADLGGNIIHVSTLDNRLDKNSVVSGVTADGSALYARFVLDATGRHSWLAQKLGLTPERHPSTQRLRFGWRLADLPELHAQPLFRQRRDGWDWLSPLGDGRCAWVKLRRSSTKGGIDYTWRIFRECAGPGYFLLGDAACLMDPSAANGVLRALMSGMYAVHLLTAIAQGKVTPEEAANEYKRWIANIFDTTAAGLEQDTQPTTGFALGNGLQPRLNNL